MHEFKHASAARLAALAFKHPEILQPPMIRDPEPWKRCPSTHCERRGECASPHECCVKPKRNPNFQET